LLYSSQSAEVRVLDSGDVVALQEEAKTWKSFGRSLAVFRVDSRTWLLTESLTLRRLTRQTGSESLETMTQTNLKDRRVFVGSSRANHLTAVSFTRAVQDGHSILVLVDNATYRDAMRLDHLIPNSQVVGIHARTGEFEGSHFDNSKDPGYLGGDENWVVLDHDKNKNLNDIYLQSLGSKPSKQIGRVVPSSYPRLLYYDDVYFGILPAGHGKSTLVGKYPYLYDIDALKMFQSYGVTWKDGMREVVKNDIMNDSFDAQNKVYRLMIIDAIHRYNFRGSVILVHSIEQIPTQYKKNVLFNFKLQKKVIERVIRDRFEDDKYWATLTRQNWEDSNGVVMKSHNAIESRIIDMLSIRFRVSRTIKEIKDISNVSHLENEVSQVLTAEFVRNLSKMKEW
jgi:hypothetical protein